MEELSMSACESQPGGNRGLSKAENPLSSEIGSNPSASAVSTMTICCEGVFERYNGVLRRARESGAAGLTPKGLNLLGLAMFAITNRRMDLSISMSTEDNVDKKATKKPAKASKGFTDEERGAMRERVKELKADKADGESAVLAKIAEMPTPDRAIGSRLHAIIKASAPSLSPKLWYGMPAYAKDGKVVCFFQPAHKFKTRYATLGFNDSANLDEGGLWPVAFALKELTEASEARIGALVKQAVR